MEYLEFVEKLSADLEKVFGEKPKRLSVKKNNNTSYEALSVPVANSKKVYRNLNLDWLYQKLQKEDYSSVLNCAINDGKDASNSVLEFAENDLEFDKVKDQIFYSLVSTELNSDMLSECPSVQFYSYSIIFRICFEVGDEGLASARITNDIQQKLGVSTEELMSIAKENTPKLFPKVFRSLVDVLGEVYGPIGSRSESPEMYVLSNTLCVNGASTILYDGVVEEIYKKFGMIAMLPSSIHEWLVVPIGNEDTEYPWDELIKSVNSEAVLPSEVLGEYPLIYDGKELKELK